MDDLGLYKGKRVLVTGHTGFKGSRLAMWLHELGAEVTGYSLGPPSDPNLFDILGLKRKVHDIRGDVRSLEKLRGVFKNCRPELVFHLAAQPLVRSSYDDPHWTYEVNVMGTVNVLEAVRSTPGIRGCLVITSDKCYENREQRRAYRETDALGGYDPYSSSKGCQELVTAAYRQSFFNPAGYGKRHHVLLASARAGNIIGGGDWGKDRLIPDCARSLSKGKSILIRSPGAIRPWQFVLEPLHGYLLLGLRMLKRDPECSGPWNFGPHGMRLLPVKEIVELAIKCWGRGEYVVEKGEQPHEAKLLQLDSSKARRYLGWKALYNNRSAVKKTIQWYRSYYEGSDMYELTLKETEIYMSDLERKSR